LHNHNGLQSWDARKRREQESVHLSAKKTAITRQSNRRRCSSRLPGRTIDAVFITDQVPESRGSFQHAAQERIKPTAIGCLIGGRHLHPAAFPRLAVAPCLLVDDPLDVSGSLLPSRW
jgi:hypothetical protein